MALPPPYRPSSRRTSRASDASTGWSRRKPRLRFGDFFSRLWLFIAWRRRSLPVPVTLKRFLAPEFVFCLGILRLLHLSRRLRRRQHHHHVPAVEDGLRLDRAQLLDVLCETHEQVVTPLWM